MKIVIKLASPKTEKEQIFRLETYTENDISEPNIAYVILNKKEYRLEIYHN
jgi:hypothetical protein